MEIKKLDLYSLFELISKCNNKKRYVVNLVCNSNDEFIDIAKAICETINKDWTYTNSKILNTNTNSYIRFIHNGYESARAYRCHELVSYNCDIDNTFKECVLLPMLRPFEEDK